MGFRMETKQAFATPHQDCAIFLLKEAAHGFVGDVRTSGACLCQLEFLHAGVMIAQPLK